MSTHDVNQIFRVTNVFYCFFVFHVLVILCTAYICGPSLPICFVALISAVSLSVYPHLQALTSSKLWRWRKRQKIPCAPEVLATVSIDDILLDYVPEYCVRGQIPPKLRCGRKLKQTQIDKAVRLQQILARVEPWNSSIHGLLRSYIKSCLCFYHWKDFEAWSADAWELSFRGWIAQLRRYAEACKSVTEMQSRSYVNWSTTSSISKVEDEHNPTLWMPGAFPQMFNPSQSDAGNRSLSRWGNQFQISSNHAGIGRLVSEPESYMDRYAGLFNFKIDPLEGPILDNNNEDDDKDNNDDNTLGSLCNFTIYAPTLDKSLHTLISTRLMEQEMDSGWIYAYRRVSGQPDDERHVKIGYTKNVPARRIAGWSKQCRYDVALLFRPVRTLHAKRVEKLIHADLCWRELQRYDHYCERTAGSCRCRHFEWFEASPDLVETTVRHWVRWMQTHEPYDCDGQFTTHAAVLMHEPGVAPEAPTLNTEMTATFHFHYDSRGKAWHAEGQPLPLPLSLTPQPISQTCNPSSPSSSAAAQTPTSGLRGDSKSAKLGTFLFGNRSSARNDITPSASVFGADDELTRSLNAQFLSDDVEYNSDEDELFGSTIDPVVGTLTNRVRKRAVFTKLPTSQFTSYSRPLMSSSSSSSPSLSPPSSLSSASARLQKRKVGDRKTSLSTATTLSPKSSLSSSPRYKAKVRSVSAPLAWNRHRFPTLASSSHVQLSSSLSTPSNISSVPATAAPTVATPKASSSGKSHSLPSPTPQSSNGKSQPRPWPPNLNLDRGTSVDYPIIID